MVELQSCVSLVNASALSAVEQQEMKDESSSVNVIAEIAAELQREREKNAELMERISSLEAQLIQERDKESLLTNEQVSCLKATERSFIRFKRQKVATNSHRIDGGKTEMASTSGNQEGRLVNWMSMDDTLFSHFDHKFKDSDIAASPEDIDDCDDEDEYYDEGDSDSVYKERESEENLTSTCEEKPQVEGIGQGTHISCLPSCSSGRSELTLTNTSHLIKESREKDYILEDIHVGFDRSNLEETEKDGEYKFAENMRPSVRVPCHTPSWDKKPPKVPFCPKEIKKMLESDALLSKNAQSHTIRKIIVFASLGIRHGCEDMYELDFNHFSILRKSPKNPGEHVLYENPGVQREVFYPNRQNPTLCPLQILEEEKARSDPSCPSCLFLCIKYGGRTRNLPQNEYVRQRMGRNKLESFGPLMCRMAMLVHIRSGSFFFKALGITLLFMAGFPDDLVQKETKYRNLDLLQKYYRTDEDAEGEELFLSHSIAPKIPASPTSQQLTGKTISTKTKGRRQTNSNSKSHNVPEASLQQSAPSSSTQIGLMGYTSIQTHAMAAFQSTPKLSQVPADTTQGSNTMMKSLVGNNSCHHLYPPQPANNFLPMVYWPTPNVFPPSPYPTNANYISIYPQLYHNHPPSSCFIPQIIEGNGKDTVSAYSEPDSDSDSSSSSMEEPKEALVR
ncbi:hypothetical protein PTKIN_Ptkin01aG0140100 [Pterospermum kingtungense]